ncbi:unnamed protein product [Discosporangium mesarthrocarpum]
MTMEASKEPKKKTNVYVGGLEESVNEEVLHAAFVPFGDIVEVNIPKDHVANTHRGFGFIEYEVEEDALAAVDNMDGSELYGKVLRVNTARPMKHKLGASTAVWSADDWFKNTLQEGDDTAQLAGDELEAADGLEPLSAAT